MKLKDKEKWDRCVSINDDPYGSGVIRYAQKWANLMEEELEAGVSICDCAQKTGSEADTEGITGFMYGCAVGMLSETWEYGEELRRWHNKDCQLCDEGDKANETGGVLNPALLSIG